MSLTEYIPYALIVIIAFFVAAAFIWYHYKVQRPMSDTLKTLKVKTKELTDELSEIKRSVEERAAEPRDAREDLDIDASSLEELQKSIANLKTKFVLSTELEGILDGKFVKTPELKQLENKLNDTFITPSKVSKDYAKITELATLQSEVYEKLTALDDKYVSPATLKEHDTRYNNKYVDKTQLNTTLNNKLDSKLVQVEEKLSTKLATELETKIEGKLETKLEGKLETKLQGKLESKLETKLTTKLENNLVAKLDKVYAKNDALSGLETRLEKRFVVPSTLADLEAKLDSRFVKPTAMTDMKTQFETQFDKRYVRSDNIDTVLGDRYVKPARITALETDIASKYVAPSKLTELENKIDANYVKPSDLNDFIKNSTLTSVQNKLEASIAELKKSMITAAVALPKSLTENVEKLTAEVKTIRNYPYIVHFSKFENMEKLSRDMSTQPAFAEIKENIKTVTNEYLDLKTQVDDISKQSGIVWLKRDYKAVGDGNADDTAAVAQFIKDLRSKGKQGFVEPGVYNVKALKHGDKTMRSGFSIIGVPEQSIFKIGVVCRFQYCENVLISDINITSNSKYTGANIGLLFNNCNNIELNRVVVRNFTGASCVYFRTDTKTVGNQIVNCKFEGVEGNQISTGVVLERAEHTLVQNCTIANCSGFGIRFEDKGEFNTISNVFVCRAKYGIGLNERDVVKVDPKDPKKPVAKVSPIRQSHLTITDCAIDYCGTGLMLCGVEKSNFNNLTIRSPFTQCIYSNESKTLNGRQLYCNGAVVANMLATDNTTFEFTYIDGSNLIKSCNSVHLVTPSYMETSGVLIKFDGDNPNCAVLSHENKYPPLTTSTVTVTPAITGKPSESLKSRRSPIYSVDVEEDEYLKSTIDTIVNPKFPEIDDKMTVSSIESDYGFTVVEEVEDSSLKIPLPTTTTTPSTPSTPSASTASTTSTTPSTSTTTTTSSTPSTPSTTVASVVAKTVSTTTASTPGITSIVSSTPPRSPKRSSRPDSVVDYITSPSRTISKKDKGGPSSPKRGVSSSEGDVVGKRPKT